MFKTVLRIDGRYHTAANITSFCRAWIGACDRQIAKHSKYADSAKFMKPILKDLDLCAKIIHKENPYFDEIADIAQKLDDSCGMNGLDGMKEAMKSLPRPDVEKARWTVIPGARIGPHSL